MQDILRNANVAGGNEGSVDIITGDEETEVAYSTASQSAATSTYEADTDNASVRSDATLTQSRAGTATPELHPRANGTTKGNGSRVSSGGGSLTLSGGAAVKHDVPTTSEEHAKWIAEAKGRLGKFAGRYGTPKVDGGSESAAEESTADGGAGAAVDDGLGAPAAADAEVAPAAAGGGKEESKDEERAGAAEVLAW